MNYTESYLTHIRNDRNRRLAACFLGYLAVSFVGSALSFLFYRTSAEEVRWVASPMVRGTSVFGSLRAAAFGQAFPALLLVLLFVSVFTMLHIPAAAAVCGIRGASLGCVCAMRSRNLISSSSGAVGIGSIRLAAGLTLYMAGTALLCLIAAVCALYSDAVNHAHWAGDTRFTVWLTREFLCAFLILTGLFFLTGMLSQFILI